MSDNKHYAYQWNQSLIYSEFYVDKEQVCIGRLSGLEFESFPCSSCSDWRVLLSLEKIYNGYLGQLVAERLYSPLLLVDVSNPWPAGYESSALTTEPQLH